jgi:hypothetical protein
MTTGKPFKDSGFRLATMSEGPLSALLQQVADDVALLPVSAVQLVGGVIAMQHDLPPALGAFIMSKLALRTDMDVVSPAAEALMRMKAFDAYSDMEFARLEIQAQHALLRAIALDDKVLVAAAFMTSLANRLADAAIQLSDAQSTGRNHSKIATPTPNTSPATR